MKYDPHKHHRRSIRLKGYDYSQAGVYFVTICINFGRHLLGNVQDGTMRPSEAGVMVADCWFALLDRFSTIDLDMFTLMPNHIHGIIVILEQGLTTKGKATMLGDFIGAFKSISTHQYIQNVHNQAWEPFHKRLWQRNYYETIIRNERQLDAIRTYIYNNPANWQADQLHPDATNNQFNKEWKL